MSKSTEFETQPTSVAIGPAVDGVADSSGWKFNTVQVRVIRWPFLFVPHGGSVCVFFTNLYEYLTGLMSPHNKECKLFRLLDSHDFE